MRLRLFKSKTANQWELDGEITSFPIAKNVKVERTLGDQYLVKVGDISFDIDEIISLDSNRIYWIFAYEKRWSDDVEELIGMFRMLNWHEFNYQTNLYSYKAQSAEKVFLDELDSWEMEYDSSGLGKINESLSNPFTTNYNTGTTPPVVGIKAMPNQVSGSNALHVYVFNPVNIISLWSTESLRTNKFKISNVVFGSSSGDPVLNYDGVAEGLWFCRGRSIDMENTGSISSAISHNFTKKGASLNTSGRMGQAFLRATSRTLAKAVDAQAPEETMTWGFFIRMFMYCANLTLVLKPSIGASFTDVKMSMYFETWGTEQTSTSALPNWTRKTKYKPDMYKVDGIKLTGDNFEHSIGSKDSNDVLSRDVFISEWDKDFDRSINELPFFFLRLGALGFPTTITDNNSQIFSSYNWNVTQNPVTFRFTPSYAPTLDRSRGYEGEILWDGEDLGDIVKFDDVEKAWGGGASDYDILFITKIHFKGKKMAVISGKVNGEWVV